MTTQEEAGLEKRLGAYKSHVYPVLTSHPHIVPVPLSHKVSDILRGGGEWTR